MGAKFSLYTVSPFSKHVGVRYLIYIGSEMNFHIIRFLSPRNSVGGDIVTRPFVGCLVSEWVRECVGACVRGSFPIYLVDTIATTVFAQSLSNFTCTFTMMRGGTLLILGHRVKGQGQLWHSVYKTLWTQYRLQFLPNHFQTSHTHSPWWEEEPYWFWVMGSKVKVNFVTLCIRPCRHDTDYSFCQITFKLHM